MSDSKPHRVPQREEVERLMKRCSVECYGMLVMLLQCVEFYQARATCQCGDQFTEDDAGTCKKCCAGQQDYFAIGDKND